MSCIRAAHLLSILSSDANEADRLGRIEFFVVIGSVVRYGNSLIEAKIANQRAALGWCWSTGGKRRGLVPRTDVLTTCKAVTLRGGQRIIAVYFIHGRYFRGEKRTRRGNSSMTENNNIMPQSLFVFLAYRICPLVLKLQNVSYTQCNRINSLTTTTRAGLSIEFMGSFAGRGKYYRSYDADKNYWRKCQIYQN